MPGKQKIVSKSVEPKESSPSLNKVSLKEKSRPLVKDLALKDPKNKGKNVFELFLHPQIQELDLKIESKQRIIDSLQSKD